MPLTFGMLVVGSWVVARDSCALDSHLRSICETLSSEYDWSLHCQVLDGLGGAGLLCSKWSPEDAQDTGQARAGSCGNLRGRAHEQKGLMNNLRTATSSVRKNAKRFKLR